MKMEVLHHNENRYYTYQCIIVHDLQKYSYMFLTLILTDYTLYIGLIRKSMTLHVCNYI